MNNSKPSYRKTAFLIVIGILLLAIGCGLWIVLAPLSQATDKPLVARIYQDGVLIQSIPLSTVEDTYTFTVVGENGCRNEIEVRPGSIGILSADCPDKLCVNQGFINTSILPITCLPNHLVIQLQEASADEGDSVIDMTTY